MLNKYLLLLISFIFSAQPAMAHVGHDHSSPMSAFIHAFFYLSLVISAGAIAYCIRKMWLSKKQNAQESK